MGLEASSMWIPFNKKWCIDRLKTAGEIGSCSDRAACDEAIGAVFR